MRIAILDSHPIQYNAPWFRELSRRCELTVLFAHRASSEEQARAGYGVAFDWDVDLTSGYRHRFLHNTSAEPSVSRFGGCDTPEIAPIIGRRGAAAFDAVIVTGWFLKTYWQAVVSCKRAGVPVLVRGDSQLTTPRSRALRFAKDALYPPLLRAFDGFLSVGARNRAYLVHYRVPSERIFAVPHVVDTERFATASRLTDEERTALRARMSASASDRVLLSVGRLVEMKRPLDLVEAVARLPDKARWVLAFAGAGPLAPSIEARARELSVRLAMLGFVNQAELPRLYGASDLLGLPSSAGETWGLVVNEAMASGLPAVVSDAAGCAPDLIDAGRTGLSFPSGDVAALARALEQGAELRNDSTARAALEEKTRAHSPAMAAEKIMLAVEAVRRSTR